MAIIQLPKGTIIYEGVAAEQLGLKTGAFKLGGGNQTFLDLPNDKISEYITLIEDLK